MKLKESPQDEVTPPEKVKVPARVGWEIRDLVHPIVLRRAFLWKSALVAAGLAVAGLLVWALFLRPPTGQEVIRDMIRAAGGADRWYAIESGHFTRERTLFNEQEEPIRTVTETFYFRQTPRGTQLVVESRSDAGEVIIGRDQDGYWALQDGASVPAVSAARPLGMMCESDLCEPLCASEMAMYRFSFPFKLSDPGVIPVFAGYAELNRVPVRVVDVTFEPEVGRDRWVFYVDRSSDLIRKVEHYPTATGDTPPQQIYWSDLREVAGITLSHRNTYYRSNGTRLEEYVITDVNFTDPVPEEVFMRREPQVAPAGL